MFTMYSYYPFLDADGTWKLSTQDTHFLEQRGCFQIPTRFALNQFMSEYFLHVHPNLPVLDEAEFWEMYDKSIMPEPGSNTLSLFVLQAMLFAACSVFLTRSRQLSADSLHYFSFSPFLPLMSLGLGALEVREMHFMVEQR